MTDPLSEQQFRVMEYLRRRPNGANFHEIGAQEDLGYNSITKASYPLGENAAALLLLRLRRRGFLDRKPVVGKRARNYVVTPAGRQAVEDKEKRRG